jgi:hypothetical protein
MKYYLVQKEEGLGIIKVTPEDEDLFWKEYGGRVKAEADSMEELLRKLIKLRL